MKRFVKIVLVLLIVLGIGLGLSGSVDADVCENTPAGQKPPITCP